jgi:YD repeat-containing protein
VTTVTRFEYDALGRLRLSRGPLGHVVETDYDPRRDLLTFVRTSVDGGARETVEHRYDTFGRRTATLQGREVERLTYDDEDRITRREDAGGPGLDFEYDGRDRLLRTAYPDGTAETLAYRPDDVVARRTDRAGNVFSYAYYPGDRLRELNILATAGFEGTTQHRFSYDGLDRIERASVSGTAGLREVEVALDARGAVLSETEGGRTFASTYDAAGGRRSLGYPGSALTLSIDRSQLGRIERIRLGAHRLVDIDFAGPRRHLGARYGNGTRVIRTFNEAREEGERRFLDSAQNLLTGDRYARDQRGNLTGIERLTPAIGTAPASDAFGYTPEGWLATARLDVVRPLEPGASTRSAATILALSYDARGNLEERTENGAATSFQVNALNQYERSGTQALTYDRNGNLRSDGRRRFEYDALNQLVSVRDVTTSAAIASYEYDALGRRVRELKPAGTPPADAAAGSVKTAPAAAPPEGAAVRVKAAAGAGRGRNKLAPDPGAQGPHTTFKRDPQTESVAGHAEWDERGMPVKRTDITGAAHGPVATPHTHEYLDCER